MLNDVMSLIVALYAIKLTGQQSDHRYTYGWHRAEILAALVNGVFLLALCFSISLEALERFFSTPGPSAPLSGPTVTNRDLYQRFPMRNSSSLWARWDWPLMFSGFSFSTVCYYQRFRHVHTISYTSYGRTWPFT
jgi:hypothetical protein